MVSGRCIPLGNACLVRSHLSVRVMSERSIPLPASQPWRLQLTACTLPTSAPHPPSRPSHPHPPPHSRSSLPGRLDFLFNNAGSSTPAQPLESVPLAQFLACVQLNLVAPFLCTQEAFRLMQAQAPAGGRILNNGSISAHAPRPFSAPYTMTKHAVTGLTKVRTDWQRLLGGGSLLTAVLRRHPDPPPFRSFLTLQSASLDGRAYGITVGQIDIGNASTAMGGRHAQGPGALQPNGERKVEATIEVCELLSWHPPVRTGARRLTLCAAVWQGGARGGRGAGDGQPAAACQHAVSDDHGERHAVRGAGLRQRQRGWVGRGTDLGQEG